MTSSERMEVNPLVLIESELTANISAAGTVSASSKDRTVIPIRCSDPHRPSFDPGIRGFAHITTLRRFSSWKTRGPGGIPQTHVLNESVLHKSVLHNVASFVPTDERDEIVSFIFAAVGVR